MTDISSKSASALDTLKTTVINTSDLILQLQVSAVPNESVTASEVDALNLAHDTASLVRAHATKLSLLIINKPFTASAVTTVLRELVAGPLPGLVTAVEMCNAKKYTKAMSAELQYRARKVLAEIGVLIKAIPLDGNVLSEDAKNGTKNGNGKGSLAVTGTVWEACDSVIELKNLGVIGLVVRKAEQLRALIKDAIEELHEWGEEESDGEDEAEKSGDEGDLQAAEDNIFGSQRHIPSEDTDNMRPRLESSLKRLQLLALMHQAVVKRRLKTLPKIPLLEPPSKSAEKSPEVAGTIERLDEAMSVMKKIPDLVDELAGAFYELDSQDIDAKMKQCFNTGSATAGLLLTNWEGQKDEFSTWIERFQLGINQDWR